MLQEKFFFVLSPLNSILAGAPSQTPLGSLQRCPGPISSITVSRGEGAARLNCPPLFFLVFQFSEPPSTFLSRHLIHEAVFCGVPNNNMTPNDIRVFRPTFSFEAINGSCKHYDVSIFFSRSLVR